MPKSKLRTSMNLDEIKSITTTKKSISIETVTVDNRLVKRPVFSQVQFNPNFRSTGSVETDEVEYDNYVRWLVARKADTWVAAVTPSTPNSEIAYAVGVADNGDIVVAGETWVYGPGTPDYSNIWVVKLDSKGDIKWQKAFGGTNDEYPWDLAIDSEGNIIVAGETKSFGSGNRDGLIIKLDPNGNIVWQKAVGSSDVEYFNGVAVAPNGDVIAVGRTNHTDSYSDVLVVRFDKDGNVLWRKVYQGAKYDEGYMAKVLDNGDILLAGYTTSFGVSTTSGLVIRIDANGNLKWAKTYDLGSNAAFMDLAVDPNGGFVFITETAGCVVKTDENGNIVWQKNYSTSASYNVYAVDVDDNGDILVAGYTSDFPTPYKGVILRLDENGNIKWWKQYGGTDWDALMDLEVTSSSGIVAVGYTYSFCPYATDYSSFWVLDLDESGNAEANTQFVTDLTGSASDVSFTVQDVTGSVTVIDATSLMNVVDTNLAVVDTDGSVVKI